MKIEIRKIHSQGADYLLESRCGLVVLQIVVHGFDINDVILIELYSGCGPRGQLGLFSPKQSIQFWSIYIV